MEDKHLVILKEYADVETDRSFSTMTTLRIGGTARYVLYPKTCTSFDAMLNYLSENGIPYKMIGKGSDILCSDEYYDGAVIRLDRHFNHSYFENEYLTAEAGSSIIALAVAAMNHSLSGLEFASGIPGTLGGALFMNAGAYRSSMSEIITEVLVYRDRTFSWIPNADCCFGYRESIFQKHPDWIIVAARMKLVPSKEQAIHDLMENRRQRRMESQPLDLPSCGSVFRNPEGMNAWQLIDGIGYRGKRVGDACVSEKHCNFIVNLDKATAKDYMTLVNEIIDRVREQYGVELQTEMEKFNW